MSRKGPKAGTGGQAGETESYPYGMEEACDHDGNEWRPFAGDYNSSWVPKGEEHSSPWALKAHFLNGPNSFISLIA